MPASITPSPKPTHVDLIYGTVWGATLLFFGAFYMFLVPVPQYLAQIGLSDGQIGLVLGAFGVAAVGGRPLAGMAADRWGPRRVLLFGALALLVGATAMPLTQSLIALFVLRLCQAVGYVAFTTAGTALVIRLTPPPIRGQRLAVFGAAANIAITIVPAVTGAALAAAPSIVAFRVSGLLALLAGGLALRLPALPPQRRIGRPPGVPVVTLGVPILTALLLGAGFAAFFQFAPLLAARRGELTAGALYTIYGLGIIAARVLAGPLLDRWRIGRTLTLGTGLVVSGLGLLALGIGPLGMAAAAVLVAVGSGIAHPVLLAHHAALLPAAPGRASALFYLGFDGGMGLGSVLFGVVLERGGLGELYGVAAVVSALILPLVPLLMRQHVAATQP